MSTRPFSTEVADVAGVKVPLGYHLTPTMRAKLLGGKYESREIKAVRSMLRPTDVVLELGAGLGVMSVVCAKIVGSQNVCSIEANPALEQPIRGVYAANGVAPRLEICVLADQPGTAVLHVTEDFWESSTVSVSKARHTVEVPKRRFAEVRDNVRPTFLILDIEGGERELVRHSDLDGIRTVMLELHPDLIGTDGCDEVIARLERMRFRLNPFVSRKRVVVLHHIWSRDHLRARVRNLRGRRRAQPRV